MKTLDRHTECIVATFSKIFGPKETTYGQNWPKITGKKAENEKNQNFGALKGNITPKYFLNMCIKLPSGL